MSPAPGVERIPFGGPRLLLPLPAPVECGVDGGQFAEQFVDGGAGRLDQDPVTLGGRVGLRLRLGDRLGRLFLAFQREGEFVFRLGRRAAGPVQRLRRRPQRGQLRPIVTQGVPDAGQRGRLRGQAHVAGELLGRSPCLTRGLLPAGRDSCRLLVLGVDPPLGLVLRGQLRVRLAQVAVGGPGPVLGGQRELSAGQLRGGRGQFVEP